MKRITGFLAAGTLAFLAGCGSDGIVFNGQKQVEQFPVRKTPIVHYYLPSEVTDPITGVTSLDVSTLPTDPTVFVEKTPPGFDLWAMNMLGSCSDNPTCRTPQEVPDWPYTHDGYKTPGAGWPHPSVSTQTQAANIYIAAWVLSLQNQWFLRDPNGNDLVPVVAGDPPVRYESVNFRSMLISIHEQAQASSGFTPLLQAQPPSAPQQEVGDPLTVGPNGVQRIAVPVNNIMSYGFNGNGAPAGLLAAGWREPPAQNKSIETDLSSSPGGNGYLRLVGVPVPDYFGGGGPIDCGGGVYMKRFVDNWVQTTSGTASTINVNDGVTYSYYLAAVGNHIIGYGVGLIDSAFALPGVVNNQEDLMNISVIFDMTAFIAAGKKFQFVVEDLLRMQDTVNGTFTNPGPLSTLPGVGR
jgi:hypothetical protein